MDTETEKPIRQQLAASEETGYDEPQEETLTTMLERLDKEISHAHGDLDLVTEQLAEYMVDAEPNSEKLDDPELSQPTPKMRHVEMIISKVYRLRRRFSRLNKDLLL